MRRRGVGRRRRCLRTRECIWEVLSQSEERGVEGGFFGQSHPLLNAATERGISRRTLTPSWLSPPPTPQLQPCPQGFRKKQSPLDIPCLLQSPRSLSRCRLRSCQSGEGEWGQPGKGLSAGGVLRDQPVRKEHCSHPNKTWLGPVITKVMPRTKRNQAPVVARMSTG